MPAAPPKTTRSSFVGGAAAELLRSMDWSANPLGPVDSWPLSLVALVRAMLSTKQATCLFWGPELINLHNDGFIPLLGEKHPAAMGQPAKDLWSDAWPVVGGLLTGVVARGEAVMFEEMRVPIVRGGVLQDAWWNYSYSPAFDDAGDVAGVLVVATETTKQVATLTALEATERDAVRARQDLEELLLQAPLPIAFMKGDEHRFVFVNEPYRRLVNRDVVGKTLDEAFASEEVGYYRPMLDRVRRTGEAIEMKEALLRLPNSLGVVEERFIDVNYRAVRDPDGEIMGTLAVMHDVTLPVLARTRESELRQAAESASLAKDEFLALVSHELRTPLNAILGWARLLDETRDAVRIEKGLAVIRRNAEAQAKLIDDILDVSRIITGKVVVESQLVDLNRVIENAVESIRPAAAAKRIDVAVLVTEPTLQLVADEARMQQVVWNLLSNAVKFTPAGGSVRVAAERLDSSIGIDIVDTGSGIAGELLPHVFERFRQGDASTTRRHGGLGLGLAIVRHIVELHGGTVSACSDGVGKGAVFRVVLPIRAMMARPSSQTVATEAEVASARRHRRHSSLAGRRILVVDDEPDAREVVAAALQDAGATVTEAGSAADALAVLAAAPMDALVSDIGMPGVDGYALIERLRASSANARIPAVALTAYARPQDIDRALASGFQTHAAKPVDFELLIRIVGELVGAEST